MLTEPKMNILVADDRPEQRLSLSAALAELGENVVLAASGREALRELLQREFAVILLDVNMPGLNGFETAALIRERRSSQHTPIIFVTAYSDDAHALRGYSLGAVDYILAPVEPQVLRTKVGVFVDLFRKTAEIKRQASSLRQRAAQLHRLTEAALAINSESSIDRMLQIVTDRAAAIIGTRQAVTSHAVNQNLGGEKRFVWLADEYADWRGSPIELGNSDLQSLVSGASLPIRMLQSELAARRNGRRPSGELPMRGWLAAPLASRDGGILGLLQLSDKIDGEFTEDDEAILLQLAQMASIAVENLIYAQEREANRLKDEFLATLSHELRTPLQAMLSWTKILRSGGLESGVVARGLEVIERSTRAQTKLIEDLLDVSRIINNKLCIELRPLDAVKVMEAAVDAVRPAALAGDIEVRMFAPSSCEMLADANRLQQIIWNLLSNAVKFTPKGGRVEVQLEQIAGKAHIRVSDTGKGIAPDFLPHIFERFRQADSSTVRAHGGLGIGLFVVRRMAELHGGSVRAESAGEGRGATFMVELPVVGEDVHAGPAVVESAGAAPPLADTQRLDGVRILLVDDEDDTRECLALAMQRCGARVTAVACAADALAVIEQGVPDVLVCDVGMPNEDGYTFIRKIRARSPEAGSQIPAAAVTAYARAEDSARAFAAGFDAHVTKPVDPAELAIAVETLLRKSAAARNGGGARTRAKLG